MTVIAWDGKTLAADKRTNFGGLHGTTTKVSRLADGRLVGCCGNAAQIMEMKHWLTAGADPLAFPAQQRDEEKSVSMLVACPDGKLLQYENTPYPLVLENKRWAIGSGRDFAVAAMHLGRDAREAVEIASIFDCGCGNGVDTLTFEI